MTNPHRRCWNQADRGLYFPSWSILLVTGIGSVVVIAIFAGPATQVGPANPEAEWNRETIDGDLVLTHEGGDSLARDTLHLRDAALDTRVTDLGNEDDDRIKQAFENDRVSEGDSIVLDGDALPDGDVRLVWNEAGGSQSATLAHLEYQSG